MRARHRLRTAPLAAAVCLALLAGACGDDGGDDDAGSTTEPSSESTTTATTEAPTSEAPTSETTAPTSSEEDDEEPVEEATEVTWDLDASQYRGNDGKRVAFDCPAGGTPDGSVWGTEVYTDDSSVCTAAVHAGLITPEDGGRVVVEIAPGEEAYEGSEANDVTSADYGPWSGSFTFPPS